jgi:hypothetical protein
LKIALAAKKSKARETVRDRQNRDRAAAPQLRASFPKLASLQLDFDFSDRTEFLPSPQVTVFHPPARAYFRFACPYSDCDGEFDLTQPVSLMMSAREPRAEGQLRCVGTRHSGIQCTLCLEFSLTAQWA